MNLIAICRNKHNEHASTAPAADAEPRQRGRRTLRPARVDLTSLCVHK